MGKFKKREMMERLGAKLTNGRWGWDGIRRDGSIVFIGWEDEVARTPEGEISSCLIFANGHPANIKPGGRERLRHIQQIFEQDCAGYLVIATAKDVNASPRVIVEIDENLYSVRLERQDSDVYAVPIALNSAPTLMQDDAGGSDKDSWDLEVSETEKQQLIQARRGQGLFRARLELIESKGCRLTGVRDRAHLRASHIKPWREATNAERLDGNNGLLLAPHVDHLFDRGFISFEDDGQMLASPRLSEEVLEAWGIPSTVSCGAFNQRQCAYLAFHREKYGFSRRGNPPKPFPPA